MSKIFDLDLRTWTLQEKLSGFKYVKNTGFKLYEWSKWWSTSGNKTSPNFEGASSNVSLPNMDKYFVFELAFDGEPWANACPFTIGIFDAAATLLLPRFAWSVFSLWLKENGTQAVSLSVGLDLKAESHILFTADCDTWTYELRYNGVVVATWTNNSTDFTAFQSSIASFLHAQLNTSRPFFGKTYYVRFYNELLSENKKKSLYEEFLASSQLAVQTKDFYYPNWAQDGDVYLYEDFRYANADWNKQLPLWWIPWTWNFKIWENAWLDWNSKVLECISTGTISLQSYQAYGTWEFDLDEWNNPRIYIIKWNKELSADWYRFTKWWTWYIRILKGNTVLFSTDVWYVTWVSNYRIKITRTTDWAFTMYIKGGSFGSSYVLVDVTWGSGTNPTINNTYTTSKFMLIDVDAWDQISNIKLTKWVTV